MIIDNLSNTTIAVLDNIISITGITPTFANIDLRNQKAVGHFFDNHTIDGVIHFAAFKAVGESVGSPLSYYQNNLNTLIYLLQELTVRKIDNFIFSSSCTVYGQADSLPITEKAPVKPAESPYGYSKQAGEIILKDSCKASELNAISLRYFNPIGAHPSIKIGELPLGVPQNLIPYITQTAAGLRGELSVFGDDYPTKDGTAVRDYIHVVDLAKAHISALGRLIHKENKSNYEFFNVGSGTGSSVLEVIKAFEKASGKPLRYKIAGRREGDVTAAYADTTLANKELKWKTTLSLDDALASAWQWQLAQEK